ncbi:helix-turn-helix domain-containing protein [Candidatus Pacearchaeota archaeon]|nr:helix-turn-helix domain-containing protein [Candidatus Pacearchaeota archaeon]
MWVAKIKFDSDGTLIGDKAKKHKISLFGFPLSYQYTDKEVIVTIVGTIFGKDADKKKFHSELRRESRVISFEINDDFFIGVIKEPSFTKTVYNRDIIHLSPALISEDGFEIVNIGSFSKNKLITIYKLLKKGYKGELISIQQKKIIELAIKGGYYKTPRKIDVKRLAKLAGLSFSTYQAHLRKAEQKLIPYFFE